MSGAQIARFGGAGLGVIATCGFGYLAIRDVDLARFREGLAESNYAWLFPALVALAVAVWIRAVRWQLLFAPETRPPLNSVTTALLIGYFFNQLLPARAGEAARVLALHRDCGTSRAEAAGTAVAERIYDVVSLLLVLFVATPFLPAVTWIHRAAIFAILFAVLVIATICVVLPYQHRPLSFVLKPLARFPRISEERIGAAAANILLGLSALRRPRLAISALALTIASWLVLGVSFWCVLIAFHLGLGYGAGILVVVTTNLALVVPSAPAAVGVFEAAVALALDPYGIGQSKALAAAVVLHALNLFPFLIVGAWALNAHRTTVRRRARAEAA